MVQKNQQPTVRMDLQRFVQYRWKRILLLILILIQNFYERNIFPVPQKPSNIYFDTGFIECVRARKQAVFAPGARDKHVAK